MKVLAIFLIVFGLAGVGGYLGYIRPEFDEHTRIKAVTEDTLADRKKTERELKEENDKLNKELIKQTGLVEVATTRIETLSRDITKLEEKVREEKAWRQEKIKELADETDQYKEDYDALNSDLKDEYGPFSVASVPGILKRKQSEAESLEEKRNNLIADMEAENDTLDKTVAEADVFRDFFRLRRASLTRNNLGAQITEFAKDWGIVHIDAGTTDGFEVGMDLLVTKENAPIAECEIIEVTGSSAIGKINKYYIDEKLLDSRKEPLSLVGTEVIIATILNE